MEIQEFVNGAESLRDGLLKQAMHYLGNGSDAEDAVQETLLKLWTVRERMLQRCSTWLRLCVETYRLTCFVTQDVMCR